MTNLTPKQTEMISSLAAAYTLNCAIFTPSYVAGTYSTMTYEQLTKIREAAKESGLMVAICVLDHTFAIIA